MELRASAKIWWKRATYVSATLRPRRVSCVVVPWESFTFRQVGDNMHLMAALRDFNRGELLTFTRHETRAKVAAQVRKGGSTTAARSVLYFIRIEAARLKVRAQAYWMKNQRCHHVCTYIESRQQVCRNTGTYILKTFQHGGWYVPLYKPPWAPLARRAPIESFTTEAVSVSRLSRHRVGRCQQGTRHSFPRVVAYLSAQMILYGTHYPVLLVPPCAAMYRNRIDPARTEFEQKEEKKGGHDA